MSILPQYVTPNTSIITDPKRNYGKTPLFDWETMDFVATPSGAVMIGDEMEAVKAWVRKSLSTERSVYLAYDSSFGIELNDIIGSGLPNEVKLSEVYRAIKEALIYDPRITGVVDFAGEVDADRGYITFRVQTIFDREVPESVRWGY